MRRGSRSRATAIFLLATRALRQDPGGARACGWRGSWSRARAARRASLRLELVAAGRGGARAFVPALAGETMPLDASDQSLLAEALDEVPELTHAGRTRIGAALGFQ